MTGTRAPSGVPFVKGHGTENDFVLLPDPDDTLEVTAGQVRAICDRHAGLGADGIIRVAPAPAGSDAAFVMDYRNADGSFAQMCGNGARVFARFLVDNGWAAPGRLLFSTRGGLRTADVPSAGDVTIGMGPATVGNASTTRIGDLQIAGVAVDVGNPHLACLTDVDLAGIDLSIAPSYQKADFPEGVNIEIITSTGTDQIRMRVHERGVGETRSCGTGTVAAAAAYLRASNRSTGTVDVAVPGGAVTVTITDGDSTLTGPAVLVASGTIDGSFWDRHR
jgi:diaminopimelate epimerase